MRGRCTLLLPTAWATVALAVPGPDSTAVLVNTASAESAAVADAYFAARPLPRSHRCEVRTTTGAVIPLADFESQVRLPLRACLDAAGVATRIEAIVVTRGFPFNVSIPTPGGDRMVSFTAALALGDSVAADGVTRILGTDPSRDLSASCGQPCRGFAWANPYTSGPFSAGWSAEVSGVGNFKLRLATRLDGYSVAAAKKIVDSAVAAEGAGATGEFLLMRGSDAARGVLDREYASVAGALSGLGLTANVVGYDANLAGRSLAALVVGTASLGSAIEGNTFLPGSLVDNLTSNGAVPENFVAGGTENQVSVARFVERGAAGVHGATDEPLNNAFPSRQFLVDYASGATLAEAYFKNLPCVYWKNLVLGDPMTAPYSRRPTVAILGVAPGETIVGARPIDVTANGRGNPLASVILYVDGRRVLAGARGARGCVALPPGDDVHLLAVAQVAQGATTSSQWLPKGWASVHVKVLSGGTTTCDAAPPDAGTTGGADGGEPPIGDPAQRGCGCGAAGSPFPGIALLAAPFRRRRTP